MRNHAAKQLHDLANTVVRACTRHPFAVCGLAGFAAGILIDADHIPLWIFGIRTGFVPFAVTGSIGEGRNLHGLALVLGGPGCACTGGYMVLMVLEDLNTSLPSAGRMLDRIRSIIQVITE